MKEILSQIVKLQAEMIITVQELGDHLNALGNTLFVHHRNDSFESDVRKQLVQQQRESRVSVLKFQSSLDKIQRAIAQLPK